MVNNLEKCKNRIQKGETVYYKDLTGLTKIETFLFLYIIPSFIILMLSLIFGILFLEITSVGFTIGLLFFSFLVMIFSSIVLFIVLSVLLIMYRPVTLEEIEFHISEIVYIRGDETLCE